ncbi:unnamed protein product, partial [Acanthoscelides obtectus]
ASVSAEGGQDGPEGNTRTAQGDVNRRHQRRSSEPRYHRRRSSADEGQDHQEATTARPREDEDGGKATEIQRLAMLTVRFEKKKKLTEPSQCYRCQRYGHTQRNCHLAGRYVKCGEDRNCSLPTPPKGQRNANCCLCGEGHPANKGCSKAPRKAVAAAKAASTSNRTSYAKEKKKTKKTKSTDYTVEQVREHSRPRLAL